MSDTPSEYKHGDTVWVKLGNCWWPGETCDLEQLEESVREDLQATSRGKLPVAVVKFFQEDSYEYVRRNDKIFPYNCSKKDEFIKKGMDMHRAKKSNMEKFPEDVVIAEKRTEGDESILEDPKFAPSKKEFSISEIFGTPKVKTPVLKQGRPKGTPNSTSGKKTPARFVTHARFIGKRNDHQRIVLVQPKKEEAKVNTFKCTICGYVGARIDAIALHMKTHLRSDPLFNDVRKKAKKRAPKKNKIPTSKTNSIEEDLALLDKGLSLSGGEISEADVPEKKKRRKRKRAPAPETPEDEKTVKKPAASIKNDLLAEWDDGEEDDDKSMDSESEMNNSSKLLPLLDTSMESKEEVKEKKAFKVKAPIKQTPKATKDKSKDNAKAVEKVKEKEKKTEREPEKKAEKEPEVEPELELEQEQENGTKGEKLEIDFTALLETTTMPTLPNLPKEVQIGAKSPEVATKLTNPKKRFVKSFEDFELSMKEKQQELAKDIIDRERMKEDDDTSSKSLEEDEELLKPVVEVKKPVADKEQDKKLTRRSTRFDKEKLSDSGDTEEEVEHPKEESLTEKVKPAPEKEAEIADVAAAVPVAVTVTEAEGEGAAEDKEPEKEKEKKVTRRSSLRMENETPAEGKVEKEEEKKIGEEKKTVRRSSTREKEKLEESVEARRSGRKGDDKKSPAKVVKDDKEAKTESESDEPQKSDKEKPVKKPKEDVKPPKDVKIEADKKKEVKPAKIDEKLTRSDEKLAKADDKPTKTDEKLAKPEEKPSKSDEKPAKKDDKTKELEKAEKLEKKEPKEKPKPKEKILFEIDVFGSLRAQENEKYNKKAEDTPRRETRASRSKSHSESTQDSPRSTKRGGRKDEDADEAQVNNGKNDESSSPLISKMKNKLMNKLSIEPPEVTPTKGKRQKRPRSASTEDVERAKDNEEANIAKDNEAKGDLKKAPESPRRQSLRSAPFEKEEDKKPMKAKVDEVKPAKAEEPAKSEIKSPKPAARPIGGPKTYLRSSRAEKSEPVVKSPLASPTRASTKPAAVAVVQEVVEKVEEPIVEEPETDDEFKPMKMLQSPRKSTDSDSDVADWLKALSSPTLSLTPTPSPKKKLSASPTREDTLKSKPSPSPKDKDRESSPSPIKEPLAAKDVKIGSPVKSPRSPVKSQQSPVAVMAPTSPVKAPTPTPLSPTPTPTLMKSPLRQSPLKSPPIILNKDAPRFDPSTPKKAAKRDEEQPAKVNVKSPRRISLSSQEVCLTDALEIAAISESNKPVEAETKPETEIETTTATEVETEVETTFDVPHSFDLPVTVLNKDVIEKNITVVPENILADGQVEIAKIIEDGTEKIAGIPNVIAEKTDIAVVAHAPPPPSPPKPIILNSKLAQDQESTSKLLDILTDNKRTPRAAPAKPQQVVPLPKIATPKFEIEPKKPASPKPVARILTGTTTSASTSKSKPTILSDTLIRPADSVVSVQKVKRSYDDIEDIDAFIITKHAKKTPSDDETKKPVAPTPAPVKSKPKILEHTIITAAGQVLQPITKAKKPIIQQQTIKVPSGSTKTVEEKVYDLLNSPKGKEEDTFDIDNMPIVMGDQLLTEAMPVAVPEVAKPVVQQVIRKQQIKPIPKQPLVASTLKSTPTTKTYTKFVKGQHQRVYQTTTTSSPTVIKHQPTILASAKQGKFVIVPSQSTAPPGTKYTVGKRPVVKKQPAILQQSKSGQGIAAEPSGNKIMIVTNNLGQQQRVLITPEQQKLIGYQPQPKKTIIKTAQSQKTKIVPHASAVGSGLIAVKKPKLDGSGQFKKVGQKFSLQGSLPPMKGAPGQTRTVIIKNQQGEIVNRIQGTSDEDIEKQVAEQLEAINRAANKNRGGTSVKRIIKKAVTAAAVSDTTRTAIQHKAMSATATAPSTPGARNIVPPLAPISAAKKAAEAQPKQVVRQPKVAARVATKPEVPKPPAEKKEDRPPKQLVIQDAMGNETTIMEGQILALPSETVDGQPQSYMLVTLDESGSLTPLNNEALMSLDPNLNLGGDLSNMVLQIEGSGAGADAATEQKTAPTPLTTKVQVPAEAKPEVVPAPLPVPEVPAPVLPEPPCEPEQEPEPEPQPLEQAADDAPTEQIHAITCSINKGDQQQNLIITGDPVATQKFLESLTEGNPDIANLLAHVEGQNILIHTDGQQILINSDLDNQMLMSLNSQLAGDATDASDAVEEEQIFATQSSTKNQDILAAALADTDVFQQEQTIAAAKITQTQLSPGYPMAVNNVLETSTVNSPIMTPLEVPSTSKIKETDVLSQVTKNVDLPITITDPNIAHSVANQQVNLMQSLTIQDVPTTSCGVELSSPTFYSLPSLDDGEKFTSPISMPLLTEDPEEVHTSTTQPETTAAAEADAKSQESTAEYLLASGDMCTMPSQIALSEPPPDMFDFPVEQAYSSSEQMPTEAIGAASILVGKSPKRGLDDVDGAEMEDDSKRAKLD